jgi:integrase
MECRETLKLEHTKANIKYAERLRGEILNAIELGTFLYAKYFPESKQLAKLGQTASADQITVGELVREQLRLAEKTLAPSTLYHYQRSYEGQIKPQWETTRLSDLTPAALRAWIGGMTLKARTVRQLLIPLRSALEQAVNDDLIEANPLDRVRLGKILTKEAKKIEFIVDPFSAGEIQELLAACDGQERSMLQFAFATGMRPSEYIDLRWSSVDWIGNAVVVERANVIGVSREETKTDAGRRAVDLRNAALDALVAQRPLTALADDHVFHDPFYNSAWQDVGRVQKRWSIIIKRSKVRRRNLYQTRHTFASTLLSTGENALYVAKQMGHKDTAMITSTYGKWIEQEGGVLPHFYRRVAQKIAAIR